MKHRGLSWWLVLATAACGGPPADLTLRDLAGAAHLPLVVAPAEVHVLVFISQECPIANAYAPTLRDLAAGWAGQPVHLYLVHVDPDLTVAAARQHALDYQLPGTVLLDPQQQLAHQLGVTRTPEAVVWTQAGVTYRGRIDDQWRALGSNPGPATEHDLRLAVETVRAGRVVPRPYPQPTGCLLPEPGR